MTRSAALVPRGATAVLLAIGAVSLVAQPASAHDLTVRQASTAITGTNASRYLTPRTHFTMAADGSSGTTESGEGIPNIDSVKKTIATSYGDTGTGTAATTDSPYIREMRTIVNRQAPVIAAQCTVGRLRGQRPAIVLDADDTTLMTYSMEVSDMHCGFDPAEQDTWVQNQRSPATQSMTSLVGIAARAGCTVIGLTGRTKAQQGTTLANLRAAGYSTFQADRDGTRTYYTRWGAASQQPSYITGATARCTTIEYKPQTRAHVASPAGGGYEIVANVRDQYSDLLGKSADRVVKLPNPT